MGSSPTGRRLGASARPTAGAAARRNARRPQTAPPRAGSISVASARVVEVARGAIGRIAAVQRPDPPEPGATAPRPRPSPAPARGPSSEPCAPARPRPGRPPAPGFDAHRALETAARAAEWTARGLVRGARVAGPPLGRALARATACGARILRWSGPRVAALTLAAARGLSRGITRGGAALGAWLAEAAADRTIRAGAVEVIARAAWLGGAVLCAWAAADLLSLRPEAAPLPPLAGAGCALVLAAFPVAASRAAHVRAAGCLLGAAAGGCLSLACWLLGP